MLIHIINKGWNHYTLCTMAQAMIMHTGFIYMKDYLNGKAANLGAKGYVVCSRCAVNAEKRLSGWGKHVEKT